MRQRIKFHLNIMLHGFENQYKSISCVLIFLINACNTQGTEHLGYITRVFHLFSTLASLPSRMTAQPRKIYFCASSTMLIIVFATRLAVLSKNSTGEVKPTQEQLISPSTYLSLPFSSVSRIKSAVQIKGKS